MSILTKILNHKEVEIAELDRKALRTAALQSPMPGDFCGEMLRRKREGYPALIAELKRASPSKGLLAPRLDLLQAAEIYTANGAAAISVLTDTQFFLGKLETLQTLRQSEQINLPLLRKDFILSEVQLYQTRAAGADAVLLIAAALPDDDLLAGLHALAIELGLTPLVEVHNEAELERVLNLKGLKLVGINNRDLNTFTISLETAERLRPHLPPEVCVVAESGIFTGKDARRLASSGMDAVLVGEALVTAPDIAARVREIAGLTTQD